MRVAGIIRNSVVNGIGIRDVIFLQGCKHHCKGCHNPETWNLEGGTEFTVRDLVYQFVDSANDVTISGGEPLLQYDELIKLLHEFTFGYNKRIWLYTGYRYDEILKKNLKELAKYVDVLVDGRFEEDKKDLTLQFRGSSNQRLIDLPKSVKAREVILWEGI